MKGVLSNYLTKGSSQFKAGDLLTWQSLEGMCYFTFLAREYLQNSTTVSYGNLQVHKITFVKQIVK
jgi:hypothetical protein